MKSIKLKLILIFTAIILALNVVIGGFTYSFVSKQLMEETYDHLIELSEQEAKYIEANVAAELKYISALAQNRVITDPSATLNDKISFFEAEASREGFVLFGYADKNGKADIYNRSREKNDVADRDFFLGAIAGKPTSSDLLVSKIDGLPALVFAAPVYRNGQIEGVLYGRKDGLMLHELVKEVEYKNTGYAYMINNKGYTVAHNDVNKVLQQDNNIENAKSNPALADLGTISEAMITRTKGTGEYTYNGVTKILGYAPVENTPWVIAFGIEKSEVLESTRQLLNMLLIIFLGMTLIGVVVTYFASDRIAKLIRRVTAAAQEIAQGNFDVILKVESKDEVGQLAAAFNQTLNRLTNYQGYIDEISDALAEIVKGNLQINLQREYDGIFSKLKENMEALLNGLNDTLLEIHQAADQVYSGSDQVANGAQALSQGATEQASSIEQLSASINEVTEQIKQNADNAGIVGEKASAAGADLQTSDGQMKEMIKAMDVITGKANEISKIIKIIDDIAFQTNILALNAAVEAARAGEAGKGFAVVADEVRNLAGKSAEAAKNTSGLIEETISAVRNGSGIADKTAQALSKAAADTLAAVEIIENIATASQEQALAIAEINQGIELVSSVVQTNAATAEESAAASQELSGQSSLLKETVARFSLRGERQKESQLSMEEYGVLGQVEYQQIDSQQDLPLIERAVKMNEDYGQKKAGLPCTNPVDCSFGSVSLPEAATIYDEGSDKY